MRNTRTTTSVLALAATLTLGLAACGNDSTVTGSTSPAAVSSSEPSAAPSTAPSPVAALMNLTGKSTAVKLDPAFLKGLTDLGLTPGVTGGAMLDGDTLTFPITGGSATYFDPDSGVQPYVTGMIEHSQSGLTLTKGDTTVELADFVVDPGASMLMGKVMVNNKPFPESGEAVPLFFLDGRTLEPLKVEGDTGVLQGTTVSLTKTAADALNMVFKTEALTEFFPVGVATITLNLK